MPKCLKKFANKDTARKYRNRMRKRNYQQTAYAPNHRQKWTVSEINMVLEHKIPDRELSTKIGRSVGAIQKTRVKYKNVALL